MKCSKLISLFLTIFAVLPLCSCGEKKASATELAMDTVINLTVYGKRCDEALQAGLDEIRRIDAMMNAHSEDSEIARLNSIGIGEEAELSDETVYVMKKALELCEKTDGAFDISIKPLSDLWDIGADEPRVPSEEEIDMALSKIGYRDIKINGNRVSFAKEGMQIDLGAVVKGYCADRIVEIFRSYGIKNALIDLGGNIYALGKNENGGDWRIGLQAPQEMRGEPFAVENLSDKTAVASGSYERYFESDGKIYHHILDPETGYPADSGLISVTVIGKSSLEADMLSTAIFVMGCEEFDKIAGEFDFEKYIAVDKSNKVITYER